MSTIDGRVADGYEAVAEQFARNFTERGDLGAAFAAYRDGQLVVDLWGGVADPDTGAPWTRDTLALVFSGTKGLSAAAVLWLVERGSLDLDAPVARYWPAFAANGKGDITVSDVMTHRSRLSGIPGPHRIEDLYDHDAMAARLAAAAPAAGERAGFTYHAITFGWLVDELVRRVDGRTLPGLFAAEFAAPLGLDTHIGLGDDEHHRVATMTALPGALADVDVATEPDRLAALNRNPLTATDAVPIWNSAAYRRAGSAAVGAYSTARSMARFYGCLSRGGEIDGVRVLRESTVEAGRRERVRGVEPLWNSPLAYATGFDLNTELERYGRCADAFGHPGFGGSIHAAWPRRRVGLSFCVNQVRVEAGEPRSRAVIDALDAASTASRA
ncbi:MAG TPA: serine hydrolase domain-containing protein [Stackebrandtia sp.]|uniref:serine hydrolase domain-containing protein n=1 Tax=Stackebrandtia sp. TaxID=2023065 RepID=UPI002D252A8B|nr:serine hydrolase domain-containing protein [Stackebrandtia sp.]HZE39220.1 serine hydrolase domain-containing protein [Stackebrandtia sp.]